MYFFYEKKLVACIVIVMILQLLCIASASAYSSDGIQALTISIPEGEYYIVNAKNGKCVAPENNSNANNASIHIYDFTGSNYQKWSFEKERDHGQVYYRIKSVANPSLELAVKNSSSSDGAQIVQSSSTSCWKNYYENQEQKTVLHEFGHALGYYGHIVDDNYYGVMKQGNSNNTNLSNYDKNHLSQAYN